MTLTWRAACALAGYHLDIVDFILGEVYDTPSSLPNTRSESIGIEGKHSSSSTRTTMPRCYVGYIKACMITWLSGVMDTHRSFSRVALCHVQLSKFSRMTDIDLRFGK